MTFALHLDGFFSSPRRREGGWGVIRIDALVAVAVIPACTASGDVHPYFVRLDARWYDRYPPQVAFVEPTASWPNASFGTPYYPAIAGSPTPEGRAYPGQPPVQFALHPAYAYPTGEQRQLACFSHSFDYYISGHNPTEDQRWEQGTHTVSATLTRLHAVLRAPSYLGPTSAVRP